MLFASPGKRCLKLLLAAAFPALASCGDARVTLELDGRAMGTTWSVQVVATPADIDRKSLRNEVADTVNRVEGRFSTYIATSEISRFNRSASTAWFPVAAEVCEVVARALRLSELSGGAFDITIAPIVDAWGFGPDFDVDGIPDAAEIDALLSNVGRELVETDCAKPAIRKRKPAVRIDLSGFAKGHAVDAVAERLDAAGIENYLVEIGGELRARGSNVRDLPWTVAIENPLATGDAPAGVVRLSDEALATSGDYRNMFEIDGRRYSHAIDPTTGRPVGHALTSVTVVHPLAADADAWATALLVLGATAGAAEAERLGIAARFLIRDGDGLTERTTARFDAREDR